MLDTPYIRCWLAAFLTLTLVACEPSGSDDGEPGAVATTTQSETARQSPPNPTPVDALPDDVHASATKAALAWCRYTQGPVPHWLLAEVIRPLSVERERPVLDELAAGVETMVADHLPRERAVMRFLARNTQCEVTTTRKEPAGALTVALMQRVPLIEEPREKVELPDGEAAQEAAWLEAFEAAWTGGFRDAPLSLRVETSNQRWYVDARLEPTFAAPKAQDAAIRTTQDALRDRRWRAARDAWTQGCGPNLREDRRCLELSETLDAVDIHRDRVASLLAAVKASEPSVRGKVLGGSAAVPVLEATVVNDSDAVLSDVWVEVRSSGTSARCRLMAAPPPNDATALRVDAGGQAIGHCRLDDFRGSPDELSVIDVVAPSLGGDPAPERTIEMPEILHRNDEYQFDDAHEGHGHPH